MEAKEIIDNVGQRPFVFLDFFPNLFNKSGKNPNGGIGLKNGFEERIFNKKRVH
jgi:hypothetical protein